MQNRLAQIRKHYHLTQEEFAERINIARSTYAKIEQGIRPITDRTTADICREFSVNAEWLRTGEGEMLRKQDVDEELVEYLAKAIKSDDDFVKKCVLLAVKTMLTMTPEDREKFKDNLKWLVTDGLDELSVDK